MTPTERADDLRDRAILALDTDSADCIAVVKRLLHLMGPWIAEGIQAAVDEERERCAAIVERHARMTAPHYVPRWMWDEIRSG